MNLRYNHAKVKSKSRSFGWNLMQFFHFFRENWSKFHENQLKSRLILKKSNCLAFLNSNFEIVTKITNFAEILRSERCESM